MEWIDSISKLKRLGISLKVISGNRKHVASYVAQEIGLSNKRIITGSELNHINSDALAKLVNDIEVFAEIEPNQKERIILGLRHSGNIVGYMGDGVNDTQALTCCRCQYFSRYCYRLSKRICGFLEMT